MWSLSGGGDNFSPQCVYCGRWEPRARTFRVCWWALVGRPGLDPGTLRVFPERPLTSITVQICWPDEVQCPPTSTEVHSRLMSWLDSWLDPDSFQGKVTNQFRGSDGEGFDLREGEAWWNN